MNAVPVLHAAYQPTVTILMEAIIANASLVFTQQIHNQLKASLLKTIQHVEV